MISLFISDSVTNGQLVLLEPG